jgi:hypothetical protein
MIRFRESALRQLQHLYKIPQSIYVSLRRAGALCSIIVSDRRQKEWREMMDSDVSHSSKIKLRTFMRDVLLFLCISFSLVGFACYCHVHFYSIFCFFFLDCSFHLPVGPHPPNG